MSETNEAASDHIVTQIIEEKMKSAYLDYAMSVIVGRALPDVRDGLKPVHRRILFAMNDLGMKHNSAYKKCARIVGEVLGKYHPHGDTAVYDSLVRMAQSFSLRYPLIDGQGNFGSIDGDNAAAMRYTEARLAKISDQILQDIDKDTVEFIENFDGSLKEPLILPSKIPNLLVNGSSGIAVGMATNIPPHNLSEIAEGIIALIDNPDIELREIMEIIQGPDFPTGGIIAGKQGILSAYQTGRGKITVKGVIDLEETKTRKQLIITEIPYQLNKSLLVEHIADCVKDKKIEGVSDLRDESDRKGMRIVVELKKNAVPEIVENQLFKHTRLKTTFGIINLALVNNEPKVIGLKDLLTHHINHRKEIIINRTKFELKKAEQRSHILEGLLIALKSIDPVIKLIKASKSVDVAKSGLISKFNLTKIQAEAILEMRLQKLTALETEKIKKEQEELLKLIKELKEILASEQKVLELIKTELREIIEKYGDERKTQISDADDDEILIEDLIKEEDMIVTITHAGYIKRITPENYKVQRRGGKGIIGTTTKEEDVVEHMFVANTHSYLLVCSDKGLVYWLKVYRIPEGTRQSKGKAIVNLLEMDHDEKVAAVIPIRQFDNNHYLIMATRNGTVKKTNLMAYSKPRRGGIIALSLVEKDKLINVKLTDGNQEVMLATTKGYAIRFIEKDARSMGRTSQGVRGIRLRKDDKVIGMIIVQSDRKILTITENGYGKRTDVEQYRVIRRGGKGVINIITNERNGDVVSVKSVDGEEDIMIMSKNGIIIRTKASEISKIGRNTQGVRMMKLNDGDKVVATAKIIPEEKEEEVVEEEKKKHEEETKDLPKKPQPTKEPEEIEENEEIEPVEEAEEQKPAKEEKEEVVEEKKKSESEDEIIEKTQNHIAKEKKDFKKKIESSFDLLKRLTKGRL